MAGGKGLWSWIAAYHRAINNLFASYGSYIARKPLLPLCLGVILLGGFCFGLFKYEKESNLQNLWVEHGSEVIQQMDFFNSRFGGISRQEVAAIVTKNAPDAQLPLAKAFDALTYSIKPLFDDLAWEITPPGSSSPVNLTQSDFCVRPLVPPTLRPGTTPVSDGNWLSFGYQFLSTCSLQATYAAQNITSYTPLPQGWGIDKFPCTKLVPQDCFLEGGDFDYPLPLRQLEAPQPALANGRVVALVDITLLFQRQSNFCINALTNFTANTFQAAGVPESVYASRVGSIVSGVLRQANSFYLWGYRWRRSYKGLSNTEILDHINTALLNSAAWSGGPTDPEVVSCVSERKACCLTWFGLHSPILAAFGSLTQDPVSGNVTKIGGIRWGQDNFNEDHPLWVEYISAVVQKNLSLSQRKDLHKGWEARMIDWLLPLRNREDNLYSGNGDYSDLQLEFLTWRSVQDIIADSGKTPIWQIILSVVLTSLYAFLAFVSFKDAVHSYTWLVLTGMSVVGLSILCGFGFTSVIGIKSSPIQGGVVPFLALAIGVDDVFVLTNTLRSYLEDPKVQAMGKGATIPERELRLTLALAGPSVILTTFTVIAAFFISSVNPMPISQWFCWQMGITATVHTIGMILIFMPVMAIDARRCKANINDPHLWLLKGIRSKETPAGPPGAVIESADITKEALNDVDELDPTLQENTASTSLSRWVAKYYAPLFKSNAFNIAVVLVSVGFLVAMSYLGFQKLTHGLNLSDVTLTGSYQNTFSKLTEERFPSYNMFIVTRDIDYPNKQTELLEIYEAVQTIKWASAQPKVFETSFLRNMYLFANSTVNSPNPIPAENFYAIERPWSTSSLGVFSLPDLYCVDEVTNAQISCFNVAGNTNLKIAATKTTVFAEKLGADTQPNLEMIRGTRKIINDLNKKFGEELAFMYGYPYLFFEQYLHSFHDLYVVVGFALVGVFVAVLIFQQSVTISLLICGLLLITDLQVFGFIHILGAKLNALSLVNLGIVIGMSAEFTYLARSFLVVEGTRQHRVAKALEWTFEPLFHGFGVQFVATFPLLFVKYPAFKLYYFAMFTMMGVFAFVNGFVLLPTLLTWFGPDTLCHIKEANVVSSRAAASRREALEAAAAKDANGKLEDEPENPVAPDGGSPAY